MGDHVFVIIVLYMAKLEVKNVSVFYENKKVETQVLFDASFKINENEITAIIGYSGSGKTTILNCISGRLVFDGEIYLDDKNIESIPVQKRNIAYVNQSFVLYPHMTIYDNIANPLKNLKVPHDLMDQKVKEISDKLGILYLLTRRPKQLSIGQQQRVAIARALVKNPDIVLFDEPLSNLDIEVSREIKSLIKEYKKNNKVTMIYVSHNINDVIELADSIIIVNEGKIIGHYKSKELLKLNSELIKNLTTDLK